MRSNRHRVAEGDNTAKGEEEVEAVVKDAINREKKTKRRNPLKNP